MKKLIFVLLMVAAIAACKNGTVGKQVGPDTPMTNTTPSSGDVDATMQQRIPRDSVETTHDSTGNIKPGDTTKGKH